jgi:hypothetical protein
LVNIFATFCHTSQVSEAVWLNVHKNNLRMLEYIW